MKDTPCVWVRGVNIVKVSVLSQAKAKFQRQFSRSRTTILNLYELQKTLNRQSSLEKNKVGNITLSDSKLH